MNIFSEKRKVLDNAGSSTEKDNYKLLYSLVSHPYYALEVKRNTAKVYSVSQQATGSAFTAVFTQKTLIYEIQANDSVLSVKKDNKEQLNNCVYNNYQILSEFLQDDSIRKLAEAYDLPVQIPRIVCD